MNNCLFCCLTCYSKLVLSCFKCSYFCSRDVKYKQFYVAVNIKNELGYDTEDSSTSDDEDMLILKKSIEENPTENIKNYYSKLIFVEICSKEFYYYVKYFNNEVNINSLEAISNDEITGETVKRFYFISDDQKYIIDEEEFENGIIVFRMAENEFPI